MTSGETPAARQAAGVSREDPPRRGGGTVGRHRIRHEPHGVGSLWISSSRHRILPRTPQGAASRDRRSELYSAIPIEEMSSHSGGERRHLGRQHRCIEQRLRGSGMAAVPSIFLPLVGVGRYDGVRRHSQIRATRCDGAKGADGVNIDEVRKLTLPSHVSPLTMPPGAPPGWPRPPCRGR